MNCKGENRNFMAEKLGSHYVISSVKGNITSTGKDIMCLLM